jgi:site-specific DNA-cytosine methylase
MSAKHFRGAASPINKCMHELVDYAAKVRPQVVIFESVQLAFTRPDGLALMRALRARLEELTNDTWTLHHVLHNAYSIGGVAHRRRYFWVASRIPFGIEWPHRDRLPVLDDAIGDLEDQPYSWGAIPRQATASWWADPRTRDDGLVDGHVSVRAPIVQRVVDLVSGVQWNCGEHLATLARRYHEIHGHLPDSWKSTEEKVVRNGFNMGYNTPVRWRGSDPARVITGAGPIVSFHPRLPRPFTHREIARIMGFPDTWLIDPLKNTPGLVATWGKGITVDCGRWIGEWIHSALDENPGSYAGQPIGDREFLIDATNAWTQNLVQSTLTLKKFNKLLGGTMTEPEAPVVPQTEGEQPTEAVATVKSGSGRPRPQATIDQDARVLAHLAAQTEGQSKDQIATALDLGANLVYLSLWRLKRDNEVHKTSSGGAARWLAGPAPTATEASEAPAEIAVPTEETVAI